MNALTTYLQEIVAIARRDDATEFSYRTPIDKLLCASADELNVAAEVLQEPSRTQNIGAPDFRVSAKVGGTTARASDSGIAGGIVGYVECKKPGADLRALITSAQLQKYRALSGNIVLTDCWRWLLLRDGKCIADIMLSEKPNKKMRDDFAALLGAFLKTEAEQIGDAKRLAAALASRCALLRDGLQGHEHDSETQSRLHNLLREFRMAINTDLAFTDFVDTFAQTLVYSLLLAKLKAPAGTDLDIYGINRYIPTNFALIRDIAIFTEYLSDSKYQNIKWIVDDILEIINSMDAAAVTESMSYHTAGRGASTNNNDANGDDTDDPYIYFYENFLAAYDAKQRECRGVYYTPPPVVKFIVRAVDDLLRRNLNLTNGLAQSDTVTALDFAAGTGTFMLEMMRSVFAGATAAKRNLLTREHILKNFYGFELLMAPYVIAHLKLSQFLLDNDVPLQTDERINVFLTNTLKRTSKQIALPMMPELAEEANRAQEIKDSPVLVITGNPPYSVASQNKGKWIDDLIDDYKFIDGKPLGERKQTLTDDYVKFIRFAQWKMEHVERGIVAVITNHGFLDNPTFRGMRQSLMNTFDALYFLDMHGNARKKEKAPDGGKDENVFDIQQGVAISILVKNPHAKNKGIWHADFYGKRDEKYRACLDNDMSTVPWRKIKPILPFCLFTPRDNSAAKRYEKLLSIKDIFSLSNVGIVTRRDNVTICFDKATVEKTVRDFQTMKEFELRARYNVPQDSVNWKVANVQKDLRHNTGFVYPVFYRPFDVRFTYYTGQSSGFHSRPLAGIMHHMLAGENLGLVTARQVRTSRTWQHCFVTKELAEGGEINYLFPLYRYDSEPGANGSEPSVGKNGELYHGDAKPGHPSRRENLNPQFRAWINDRYGRAPTPEDILACIYAILHSPDYRKRYADFLRTDFPRIPFPESDAEFTRLATIGNDLVAAHLLRANCTGDLAEHKGTGNTHVVEKINYNESAQRLHFNPDEHLAPLPPEVYNFQIGGYRPLDKYLKSRKGRTLTLADTETLQKAANAIAFTIAKMGEIDQ